VDKQYLSYLEKCSFKSGNTRHLSSNQVQGRVALSSCLSIIFFAPLIELQHSYFNSVTKTFKALILKAHVLLAIKKMLAYAKALLIGHVHVDIRFHVHVRVMSIFVSMSVSMFMNMNRNRNSVNKEIDADMDRDRDTPTDIDRDINIDMDKAADTNTYMDVGADKEV
jgi:hypothetical protein